MSPDEQQRFQSNELAELIFGAWLLAERISVETGRPAWGKEFIVLRLLLRRVERLLAEFREPLTMSGRPLPELRETVCALRLALEPETSSEEVRFAVRRYCALFRPEA
jgi:hypothetical protein